MTDLQSGVSFLSQVYADHVPDVSLMEWLIQIISKYMPKLVIGRKPCSVKIVNSRVHCGQSNNQGKGWLI